MKEPSWTILIGKLPLLHEMYAQCTNCCANLKTFQMKRSFSLNVLIVICHPGNKYLTFLKKWLQIDHLCVWIWMESATKGNSNLSYASWSSGQECLKWLPILSFCRAEGWGCGANACCCAYHKKPCFSVLKFPADKYIVQDDFGE